MTTDKSSIKRKLGEQLVELALAKVDAWTVKELANLGQKTEYPICLQVSDNVYWVGTHKIQRIDSNIWRVFHNDRLLHEFYSQQAAVFYAVYYKCKMYSMADQLLMCDRAVVRSDTEHRIYQARITKLNKNDEFRYQLYTARLEKARGELEQAKKELRKTLDSAKYNKIWDKIL